MQQKKLLRKSIHMQYLQLEKAVTPMHLNFAFALIRYEFAVAGSMLEICRKEDFVYIEKMAKLSPETKDLFESGANDDLL